MSKRGFTLIELLIAVAIFVFVATALVMSQLGALRAHKKAREVQKATQATEQFLSQLRANPADVPTLCPQAAAPLSCSYQPCTVQDGNEVCGSTVSDPTFYRVQVQYTLNQNTAIDITTYIYEKPQETEEEGGS